VALVVAALVALAGCADFRARYPGPDILFVATPEQVGVEMLRLASVTSEDVVFDLGSGDGRLVIAAAHEFGARGVGVEIDAPLVQTSREHARTSGVADRVTFLWQDLFVTDLSSATVVAIYLRDDVNLKLRPKLLSELRAGSRLVSHDFGMGDWEPDRVQRVQGPTRLHTLYFWVIPGNADGVWQVQEGGRNARLTLGQRYQTLSGTLTAEGGEQTLTEGRMTGDRITFTAGGQTFTGRVSGEAIENGTVRAGAAAPAAWSARRVR
jgi:SAM-dependent methyltransferase